MTDTTAVCAKIIRRYATLREEYLHGKSRRGFQQLPRQLTKSGGLMCEISGLRKSRRSAFLRCIRGTDGAALAILGCVARHGGGDPQ